MNLLARKLRRELWRGKAQALAVVAVTMLGVLLFVASAGGYTDLRDSYTDTNARLALADLHVKAEWLRPDDVARVRATSGVARAEPRVVTALPVSIDDHGTPTKVELRLISIPQSGEEQLDKLLLVAGHRPTQSNEVVVEKHLATTFHLKPGDRLYLGDRQLGASVWVSGVAVSAEYLWVARSEHDPMPDPRSFGVAWMRRGDLRSLAHEALLFAPDAAKMLPGLDVAASADLSNELLVDEVANDAVDVSIRNLLAPRPFTMTPRAQLVGPKLLSMDVDGYKQMAGFFPVLFLVVAAMITASVLGRLVDAQRPIIGTLSALGVGRGRILGHYLAHALALGLSGSLLGAVAGVFGARAMTHEYAAELGIPFVTAHLHVGLGLVGIALGTGVALVAGWLPAWRASGLAPAEAMRPPAPHTGLLSRLGRNLKAPLAIRLAIRNVLSRPLRALATSLGVAAALVLVLTTGAMVDSMRVVVDVLFHDARTYDLRVDLVQPMPGAEVRNNFAALPGVDRIEPLVLAPVTLAAHGEKKEVLLQGLDDGSRLVRSFDVDAREVRPEPGGIVLTRAVAKKLKVQRGDTVEAFSPIGGTRISLRVSGFADAAMGSLASVRRADVAQAFGADVVTSVALTAKAGQLGALRTAIANRADVAHVEDLASLRAQLGQLMALGWAMLGMMLACAVVLAAAILFNTATLGVIERARELATLRAFGRSMREITATLTFQHALLALVGLAIGLPVGIWTTKAVLASYSSELFPMPFVLTPATLAVTALGIPLVLVFAQWPALRQVAKAPLVDALRTRED